MMVDGVLYCETAQPILLLQFEYQGPAMYGLHLVPVLSTDTLLSQLDSVYHPIIGIYSLSDFGAAMDRALALAASIGNDVEIKGLDDFSISIPKDFDFDASVLNAAVFANSFLNGLARHRGRRKFLGRFAISLGKQRLNLIKTLIDSSVANPLTGSSAELIDAASALLDLPDSDPIWVDRKHHWVEYRSFLRTCLENAPITLEIADHGSRCFD